MEEPKYIPLRDLIGTAFNAIYWTVPTTLGLLWDAIKVGPAAFFYVQRRNARPACLEDETLGEHGFVRCKHQRVNIHYVADGDRNNPLMLFLHGFPEFWYSWKHQMREFSRDYRVVAIDMRGYGESDKPTGIEEYRMDKLTFDVKEVIEGLGYNSCVLVGHDWGGNVAWTFSLQYPTMVNRLILCNIPHPRAFGKHFSTAKSQQLKSWYMSFFQAPVVPEVMIRSRDLHYIKEAFTGKGWGKPGVFTDEEIEAFKYTFSPKGAVTGPLNYYRAALRYRFPSISSWRINKIPVLVIWGTDDGALEKEMASMSAKYVEDFTLHFIEGASHWVQNEKPKLVNKYMRDFLKNNLLNSKL